MTKVISVCSTDRVIADTVTDQLCSEDLMYLLRHGFLGFGNTINPLWGQISIRPFSHVHERGATKPINGRQPFRTVDPGRSVVSTVILLSLSL